MAALSQDICPTANENSYFSHVADAIELRRLALMRCLVLLALLFIGLACGPMRTALRPQAEERLAFQAYDPWSPRTNLNADVAMVYGIDESLPRRMESWQSRGYSTHVMTGAAWGEYLDYIDGRWDGKDHFDEIQTERSGQRIAHGKDVFYMSPGDRY